MTSAACPVAFPSDPLPLISSFDPGLLPWDFPDNFFVSNNDEYSPNSGCGSDNPNQDHGSPNSNSTFSGDPPSPIPTAVADERKKRRMLSNRESARRSRMRKQKHLENLRNQVSRLKLENRDIGNRLALFLNHGRRLRLENDQLRSNNLKLRQKLSDVCHVLLLRQQLNQHHQQQLEQEDLTAHAAWTCVDEVNHASNSPSEHNPTSAAE
ncbi:hypothetical protein MLD38_031377 [Melastoma candidum]|uniref:Uncharacterized protein n=1 Tax=Melastoma candidum TaxID=119954 RepID=A0ACB9MP41_9MYRT|nr:hypothetical protein MLD38_031377 [Melastoma candidum]